MNILFVHQNYPGQFKSLAPALRARGHHVIATTMRQDASNEMDGVKLIKYTNKRGSSSDIHPWVSDFETKVIRGEAFFYAALQMKAQGYKPDVVIAHPGWGEILFVRQVWPQAKIGVYCEFYYAVAGTDYGFDPEFASSSQADACRVLLKNVNNLLNFEIADAGISPTYWQASTFPDRFRTKISVIHDGVNSEAITPNPGARLNLKRAGQLTRDDEIITFVSRNLEPTRGYHIFMRALPLILKSRPKAKILIIGGDSISYGAKAPEGSNWRSIYIQEVRAQISDVDWARVSFLGNISYTHFISMLQISSVHVYLTYPFVLSWSLLEAMSVGCAIVASNTQPVREAIRHNDTGRLIDFFDVNGLVQEICYLLDDPVARQKLGVNARAFVKKTYDLQTVCLPRQIEWVESLDATQAKQ